MTISESHSYNLACRDSCILGFEFHRVVLFGSHLDRDAVLAFLGQLLRGSSTLVRVLIFDAGRVGSLSPDQHVGDGSDGPGCGAGIVADA